MPSFLSRSPARDRDRDRLRFEQLSSLAYRLADEIMRERAGLKHRYERTCGNAAFAMQEYEAEKDPLESRRIDEMTLGIVYCSARLAELERQLLVLRNVRCAVAPMLAPAGASSEHDEKAHAIHQQG